MYKSILSIIFTATVTTCAFAQEIQFGLGSGVGIYKMSDLKDLNTKVRNALTFPNKTVNNFPAYWYYHFSAINKEKKLGFGISYNFQSTGSRIASQDYSGQYKFDNRLYSHEPGLYAEFDIPVMNNLNLGLYTTAGIELTYLTINEYLRLSNTVIINKSYKFDANNVMIHPGIEINYRFNLIGIKLNAGYVFQTKTDYFSRNKDPETSPYIVLNTVKPDWSGLRIGLSVFYRLKYPEEENEVSDTKTKNYQHIHQK
jgi:hypothetical protein